jgi:hypothetical protein
VSEQPADPAAELPWTGQPADHAYANVVKLFGGPLDVMLIFGILEPTPGAPSGEPPEIKEVMRISMSWAHLKSMIPLLARIVADYESKVGQVPAPGFDELWKG